MAPALISGLALCVFGTHQISREMLLVMFVPRACTASPGKFLTRLPDKISRIRLATGMCCVSKHCRSRVHWLSRTYGSAPYTGDRGIRELVYESDAVDVNKQSRLVKDSRLPMYTAFPTGRGARVASKVAERRKDGGRPASGSRS